VGAGPDRPGGLGGHAGHRRAGAATVPFIWEPKHLITSSQYSVLYAFEVGIGILIGGYGMGWLADKIGRRNALMLSAVLAAAFSWPFAYVTSYPALLVLSIFSSLGVGGALAINVVYMSEMTSPAIRGRVVMGPRRCSPSSCSRPS
jgi:MFS family permease